MKGANLAGIQLRERKRNNGFCGLCNNSFVPPFRADAIPELAALYLGLNIMQIDCSDNRIVKLNVAQFWYIASASSALNLRSTSLSVRRGCVPLCVSISFPFLL
jgi:hypothetical protein